MSESKLDQIVKGIPRPGTSVLQVAAAAISRSASPERAIELHESKKPSLAVKSSDSLSHLPSSPSQIYLNLLILEASLRSQYLALRARRRQHSFFISLLFIWIAYFFHAVFWRPREDGRGRGGSPYWVVDMFEKTAFMGGVLTAVLMWATGQWERGIRWPRRWIWNTNRGLRVMNLKVVILKGPWWRQLLSWLAYLFPSTLFSTMSGSSYHYFEYAEKQPMTNSKNVYREGNQVPGMREEDIAPGGNHVRLLILPKNFSAEFRENWEVYRTEYWEKENERRAELRKIVSKREHDIAKQQGGWLWWIGWRGWKRITVKHKDRTYHSHHGTKPSREMRQKRIIVTDSHSRSSSRSSTTTPDKDDFAGDPTRPIRGTRKSQRMSNSTNGLGGPSFRTTRVGIDDIAFKYSADNVPTLVHRGSNLSTGSSGTSDGELSEKSSTSQGSPHTSNNR